MRRLVGVVMPFVLLASCGDDGPATKRDDAGVDTNTPDAADPFVPGTRSGSRIKLRHYVFADGAKHLVQIGPGKNNPPGLHDQVLDFDCSIEKWTQNTSYCTPNYLAAQAYSDAGCSQPVIGYPTPTCGATLPAIALKGSPGTCVADVIVTLYKPAALPAGSHFYTGSPGSCTDGGVSPYPLYGLGEEIQRSTLAEITTTQPIGDDPIKSRYYQSADGFQAEAEVVTDTSTGIECIPEQRGEGHTTVPCLPELVRPFGSFSDNLCTSGLYPAPTGECLQAGDVYMKFDSPCYYDPPATGYYRRGAQVSTPSVVYSGASCTSGAPGGGATFYSLEPISVPQITRTRDASGGHRVQPITLTSGGFSRTDRRFMYDSLLDTECEIWNGRCAPIHTYVGRVTRYTDAGCQNAIELQELTIGSGSCTATFPKYSVKQGSCAEVTEVNLVGAAYTSPVYMFNSSNNCVSDPTTTYYSIGAPMTDIPTVTLQTDP